MGPVGGEDIGAFSETPVEAPDGKSVQFRLSRNETGWILWTLLGVGVFVLALSFFFAWRDGTGFPWGHVVIVGLTLAFPLGVTLWMRRRARQDRSVHLAISTAGLLAPKTADRLIPWDALEKVSSHGGYYKGQRRNVFLALHTFEPDRFGAKGGNWTRKMNRWWYGTDIVFPLEALVGAPEDVREMIRRFAPADLLARSGLSPNS